MAIERRFNRPLYEVNKVPIAWISEKPTTEWPCNACMKMQGKGSVCVEMFGKRGTKIEEIIDGKRVVQFKETVIKKYVCTKCAAEMYEKVLDRVKLVGERGVGVYRLLQEM